MASRVDLHNELKTLLGSQNVYYQAPESVRMEYPAIRYTRSDVDSRFANDKPYIHKNKYEITVIDRKPDNQVIDKLLKLPMCTYNRHYTADNLHHDVISLYY